jgi:predicted ATP-dependent endonuclease of OLD family
MDPLTREHNIKLFKIESLFNDRDINISFDKNFRVLIGENGLGKTSLLNALYYTLTGKFSKLSSLVFKKIVIEFNSGKKVEIERDDLDFSEEEDRLKPRQELRIIEGISQQLTENEKEFIASNIGSEEIKIPREIMHIVHRIQKNLGIPSTIVRRTLILMFSGKSGKLEEARRTILKEVDAQILYFPTYRRIEEELHKLGALDQIKMPHDDKRLIQFGMEDVSLTLNKVIESIKNSAILGFSEITGEMLSQYLEGAPKLDGNIRQIIVPDILKIILERVGTNITEDNKAKIMQLVESDEIFENTDYKYLLNFLSKLVKIYDQQKDIDNSIKGFESTCNGYLTGKKVIYNESKVTINVIQEETKLSIELKNLSSGEKQIISLFTKILFNESQNIIVLFDEPELSLSIEWQRKLLPDILKSKKCKLLLCVTHSPFIFDNDLDEFAEDMSKYVSTPTHENNILNFK